MRLRNFLIIAIGIIAVAAVVVLLLPALQPAPAPVDTGAAFDPVAQVQVATAVPIETPLPTPTPINFIDLVIAVQELPRGIIIPFDAVQLRPWVADIAPFNAITNLEDVIGKRARTDIFREQPILSNMVVDDLTEIARVGSDAAAVLPDGLVAISLPIDRLTGIAYAVQDGDRVDLIISLLFVDVDEEFQSLSPNSVTLITRNPETNGFELSLTLNGRPESTSLGQGIISHQSRSARVWSSNARFKTHSSSMLATSPLGGVSSVFPRRRPPCRSKKKKMAMNHPHQHRPRRAQTSSRLACRFRKRLNSFG